MDGVVCWFDNQESPTYQRNNPVSMSIYRSQYQASYPRAGRECEPHPFRPNESPPGYEALSRGGRAIETAKYKQCPQQCLRLADPLELEPLSGGFGGSVG